MISKLVIRGIEIPITKELPVSINMAVSDVRELDRKSGTLTKTLVVYGSQPVNELFENIYKVNSELSVFDPNVAETAIYYLNEKQQIKGDLQLLKIVTKPNGAVEYHLNIIGREGSFFVAIGDALLTDLDFSDLDHTYNKTEQKNSWATSYRSSGVATTFAYGEGYVYPHIKYGYAASDTTYDVTHFKPAIPAREYMSRIFDAAGYTWESGCFFDSTLFKHLYIPCNRDKIELSNSSVNASQYYIGKTAATVTGWKSGTSSAGGVFSYNNQAINPNYDLETAPYFDGSNQYDSVTNFYSTIANTGVYNVVAFAQMDITVNAPSLVGGTWDNGADMFDCYIEKNTGSGWVLIAAIANPQTATNQNLGTAKSYTTNAQSGNVFLTAGTLIRVRTRIELNVVTKNSGGTGTSAAYTVDYTLPNGASKNSTYLLRTDTTVADGNTLTMNNAIPLNIKQRDFVRWILQMFKLNIEVDKTNETNLIVEAEAGAWYTATVENWTAKVDYSKDWEQKPMGELDAINYVWKYKDDKDYYNDLYQKQYTDNYGLQRLQIANDFNKNEKKIEVGFSPTPLVGNSSNNIICPHIYAKETAGLKPIAHNIRILYYGGLKNSGAAWTYTGASSGTTSETQYAYMGHLDDPTAPTIDLNFDYPKETYYTYPLAYMTTNNLYNAYYSQYVNQITDKDSKLITCWVRLDEIDILHFTFRNKVFIDHPVYGSAYYSVNKIVDYNPLVSESTKVELVKVKPHSEFVSGAIPIDPAYDPVSTARIAYNPNTNDANNSETSNTLAVGNSNRIMGDGNTAVGSSGCFVDETSTGVTLINCTEVSVVGGTNITVIGASNRALDSTNNNTVINDSSESAPVYSSATKTSDFNVDSTIQLYYIDCTSGNITATFDISTCANRVFYFKRIDSSGNTFSIDEVSGLPSIDGNAVPYNTGMVQYDSITLGNDGTNFYFL